MERGLMWLPLLAVFIWLAWAGWNEYQKVEAYKLWAQQFERAKYDILAALGQSGTMLTWGSPTRQGPKDLHSLDLTTVSDITLWADGEPVDLEHLPQRSRRSTIRLQSPAGDTVAVPFTDLSLAVQWFNYLQQAIQALQSASSS